MPISPAQKQIIDSVPGLSRYATEDNGRFLSWAVEVLPRMTFREVLEFYKYLANSTHITNQTLAGLGLIDRYFLLTVLMNRPDAYHPWLYERCREVEAQPTGYLDLWAREHYKSTIITFAGIVQEIMRDPEITIGLFSHSRPIAKAFLIQVKGEFERNEKLMDCYPDVLYRQPTRESPKWSEDGGLVVKRNANPKESTLEAWGLVDGQPTSKHFRLRIYDDVVTLESVSTPEQIKKTTTAYELSTNLGAHGGAVWHIGTRYHAADTWRVLLDRAVVLPRIHPATHNGRENGKPVFLTTEQLAVKRREQGPYTFAAQMLQNPTADRAQGFQEDWLVYWRPVRWRDLNRYILVDPAGAKKKNSDYTVMIVIGLGPDNKYRVIDWFRDRLNLTQRANLLMKLHRHYQPLKVGYERYGKDSDIEHIQYMMGVENYTFEIVELGGPMPKEDRIKRLVPVFEQGRMILPEGITHTDYEGRAYDPSKVFVDTEYLDFPVCAHDDMLDDLARILEDDLAVVWPKFVAEDMRPDWMKQLRGGNKRSWMSR